MSNPVLPDPSDMAGIAELARSSDPGEVNVALDDLRAMIGYLDRAIDQVDSARTGLSDASVRESTVMGDNPVGREMTREFARRATGDQFSFQTALDEYQKQLRLARGGLQGIAATYERVELSVFDVFSKSDGPTQNGNA